MKRDQQAEHSIKKGGLYMGEGDANRWGRELWLSLVAKVLALPPPVLSSGLCLLAADLRRHPTQSTGILGIPPPHSTV